VIQARKGRRGSRAARIIHQLLIETFESRILLCGIHDTDANEMGIRFYSGDTAPVDLNFTPSEPAPIVGPGIDLTGSTSDLFNPITDWDTAANGLPILNSLPGAPTAIYLDFDGDTGSKTNAYSEDTDTTTYNQTEQTHIVEAWRQISTYFAMFDVNVTTAVTSLPKAWEMIGNGAGGSTGGYAFVGTFPNSSPQAFNESGNARSRESGMAHEVGHVFGLQHQSSYDALGVKTNEYISAVDSLHGAIMGVDYSGSVHKWFIGHPSTSVTSLQDDMAVIAGRIKSKEPAGGDGYRPDDFGNALASATPLSVSGGLQFASGIIERRTDVDAFSFTASDGGVSLAAVPDSPSGVDLKLEVYDSSGKLVAAKDGSTNDQRMTLALPAGVYYALLSSLGDYGDQGMYDFSVRSLPAGWNSADVGTVGQAGYTEYDASTGAFTNAGGGSAVSGSADSLHYVYQTLNGDGDIIARVTQNQNTNAGAKVGLDIRDGLLNNSRHVSITLSPTGGAQFITRSTAGGSSTVFSGSTNALPGWVRLVREGNVFTGYVSEDGVSWTKVSQSTVSMNTSVNIGLITSAGTTSKLDSGIIDSVSITGDTTPVTPTYNALPAPTGLAVAPATSGTGLTLTWSDVADSTGFSVLRSSDGITFAQITTTAAGMTTYTDPNPGVSMRYFYKVAALDATGASAPSTAASAVNRPPAPGGLSVIAPSVNQIVLNWKDVSGDNGYRIERSTDGVNFSTLTTVGVNVPSYTNSSVTSGTTYTYRIVTLSPEGESLPSATFLGASRLAAVTGAAFNAVTANAITLHWTDISGETGYRIDRSSDGTTWTTLTTAVGQNITTYTDTTVTPLKEYYYRVYGKTAQALSLAPSSYIFAATPAATPLPSPWISADIGTVYGRGASGYSSSGTGTYTLISSGSDIAGSADSFHYTYRTVGTTGQIVARVASIENTDDNAKVGVMIRANTAAGAAYMGVFVTAGAGVTLQTRAVSGGATTATAGPTDAAAPYWVKMVRSGNSLSAFYSSDGQTWTQIGTTITINLSSSAMIGLASTSKSTTLLSTATVTNVIANVAPTIVQAASATPLTNTNTSTLTVLGADDAGESTLRYTWSVAALPAGATPPSLSVNGNNAAKYTVATFFASGTYQFLVRITDADGLSVTSSVTVNATLNVPPTVATPASAGAVSANRTVDLSVLGADDQGESNLTYTWTTIASPDGATSPAFSVNATNAASNTTATLVESGDYQFRVTITDAAGLSVTSDVDVNLPVQAEVTAIVYDYRNHISVTFNQDVSQTLQKEDLSVQPMAGGDAVTPASFIWDVDSKTATFEFAVDFANGDYHAALAAPGVSDPAGGLDFFALAGDINRDRAVDFNDLVMLAQNYNSTGDSYTSGDLTGDGNVDFNDLVILAQGYNTSLAPVTPPASAPATPTSFSTTRIKDASSDGDVLQPTNNAKVTGPRKRVAR
jgi:hypothetical protein